MTTKNTIYGAIRTGKLKESFNRAELRKACPQLKVNTANTFINKHCVEYNLNSELSLPYFIRVS